MILSFNSIQKPVIFVCVQRLLYSSRLAVLPLYIELNEEVFTTLPTAVVNVRRGVRGMKTC